MGILQGRFLNYNDFLALVTQSDGRITPCSTSPNDGNIAL